MLDEIVDVVGHAVESSRAWRYVISRGYRRRVHAQWRHDGLVLAAGEVVDWVTAAALIAVLAAVGLALAS